MTAPLTARRIVALLEAQTRDRRPVIGRITAKASLSDLIAALELATTPLVREIVCRIIGDRYAEIAVPNLIKALGDESAAVRYAAADALAKIGDARAGPPLLERFNASEDTPWVKHMLALALGAVGYQPAIKPLVQALSNTDPSLRGCAAWSLGALGAVEAKGALRQAIASETEIGYTMERLREALDTIQLISEALSTKDESAGLLKLAYALNPPSSLRAAAASAIGRFKSKEAEKVLQTAFAGEAPGFVAQRIKESLELIGEAKSD